MFEVFLFQLACCCEEMESIATGYKKEMDDIDNVISELSSLTGLDQPIGNLKKKKDTLKIQYQMLLSMAQGLGKIRLNYMKTEQQIFDNVDGIVTCRRLDVMDEPAYFTLKSITPMKFIT